MGQKKFEERLELTDQAIVNIKQLVQHIPQIVEPILSMAKDISRIAKLAEENQRWTTTLSHKDTRQQTRSETEKKLTMSVQAEEDNGKANSMDTRQRTRSETEKKLTMSVQTEEDDDSANSMDFPENVSEQLVDIKIQSTMEEAPKLVNVDAIDSLPEIPNDIEFKDKALVEEKSLASQFPRPVVETKSLLKDQTIKLLIENLDAEEDEDEEQDKGNCMQRQIMGKNELSLRQLRKMFKEQLLDSKKKMDGNNTILS